MIVATRQQILSLERLIFPAGVKLSIDNDYDADQSGPLRVSWGRDDEPGRTEWLIGSDGTIQTRARAAAARTVDDFDQLWPEAARPGKALSPSAEDDDEPAAPDNPSPDEGTKQVPMYGHDDPMRKAVGKMVRCTDIWHEDKNSPLTACPTCGSSGRKQRLLVATLAWQSPSESPPPASGEGVEIPPQSYPDLLMTHHPDDGHGHHFACLLCGANPTPEPQTKIVVERVESEFTENEPESPDTDPLPSTAFYGGYAPHQYLSPAGQVRISTHPTGVNIEIDR